ncbi:sensor histidine kinase [Desulfitobacterium metallireducens]|uniref:histidine kinase n=1 Tax=Desulfitobacterium metallireducens DSM 15288 TaxID=871968 RepID=W0E5K3_9FIRM|nr:HAMP domain-containing sensor histidine kinase [Desulfitobacterium metallireducens]AHF06037.1 membrane protein [Desulfitobacterium metallireducens DSM 15288]
MLSYQSNLKDPGYELNKENLFSLLDKLPYFVCLLAPDFTIPYYNQAFQEVFGDPGPKKCYEFIKNSNKPCLDCPSFKTWATSDPLHWEMKIPDSRVYRVHERLFVGQNSIPYICKSGEDITEGEIVTNDYARMDRLNLIAEMAAGIAHEIRNPITTVKGFLQMLGWKNELKQYQDYYDIMIAELERANSIITEFLSLTKTQNQEMHLQNLNTIIQTLFPLIQADAMRSDITLIQELGEIEDIQLDEKEIRQLILNLVRNGIEATEPGKTLKIKTSMDSDRVVLAIHDEGPGIDPDVLAKLGVPFFTTKEGGTGLGLAICHNIIKRHDAKMDIVTSPQGTTFFVKFKTSQI